MYDLTRRNLFVGVAASAAATMATKSDKGGRTASQEHRHLQLQGR